MSDIVGFKERENTSECSVTNAKTLWFDNFKTKNFVGMFAMKPYGNANQRFWKLKCQKYSFALFVIF